MDDEKIIELFFNRSEQAIEEVDKKYGKTCHNISYNILHNKLDAEECVNDAYLGAWNAIPPARPSPLLTYLCKIVRNLSLKRYEFNTAIKRNSTYDVAKVADDIICTEIKPTEHHNPGFDFWIVTETDKIGAAVTL